MTEELVIREIRIDVAAGRSDSDSQKTSFEVIMPLNSNQLKYQYILFETYNLCCIIQYLCIIQTALL